MNANNNFIVRAAESGDAAGLAKVHIAAWKEIYKGIMPDSVLDGQTHEKSMQDWTKRLAPGSGQKNFAVLDGMKIIGFSGGGKAREKIGDFDGEMYAIYLLKKIPSYGPWPASDKVFR